MLYLAPNMFFSVLASYQAYQSAAFEFSVNVGSRVFPKILTKGEKGYDKALEELHSNEIKKEILPFLQKHNVREDLIILEDAIPSGCGAIGTNYFRKNDALIILEPGLYKEDKEACLFFLKHEISHIKYNDAFVESVIRCICTLASGVFGFLKMRATVALLFNRAISFSSESLFFQWRERKADDFAIENSSNEELLGGRRYLLASQQFLIEERYIKNRIIDITSTGESRFDSQHPLTSSRIRKIEKALIKRGCSPEYYLEDKRTLNLRNLRIYYFPW